MPQTREPLQLVTLRGHALLCKESSTYIIFSLDGLILLALFIYLFLTPFKTKQDFCEHLSMSISLYPYLYLSIVLYHLDGIKYSLWSIRFTQTIF